jgi:eukaryotic-like serine/threonine-protein kinase
MTAKIILTFTNRTVEGQKHEFTQPTRCVIGRSNDCDIQLPTTLEFMEVSRHHCILKIDPPALQVRDLGSRNGTFLNGENIGQRCVSEFPGASKAGTWHTLKEGDELLVGETTIRVGISPIVDRESMTEATVRGAGPRSCADPALALNGS